MDREFTLEIARVTEFAAIAAAKLRGKGDEKMADQHFDSPGISDATSIR